MAHALRFDVQREGTTGCFVYPDAHYGDDCEAFDTLLDARQAN